MTDQQKQRLEKLQNKGKLSKAEQKEYQTLSDLRYTSGENDRIEEDAQKTN